MNSPSQDMKLHAHLQRAGPSSASSTMQARRKQSDVPISPQHVLAIEIDFDQPQIPEAYLTIEALNNHDPHHACSQVSQTDVHGHSCQKYFNGSPNMIVDPLSSNPQQYDISSMQRFHKDPPYIPVQYRIDAAKSSTVIDCKTMSGMLNIENSSLAGCVDNTACSDSHDIAQEHPESWANLVKDCQETDLTAIGAQFDLEELPRK